jgi:hypothetical protein
MRTDLSRRITALAVGVAAVVWGMAPTASAYTQYDYTGNNYTSVSGQYTTAMSLTGSITLPGDLSAHLTEVNIGPFLTSFFVFDGLNTYTEADLGTTFTEAQFFVTTDAASQITEWMIVLSEPPDRLILTCSANAPGGNSFVCDSAPGAFDAVSSPGASANVFGNPGGWVGVVPEPEPVPALGPGLTGILVATMVVIGVRQSDSRIPFVP